MKTVFILNPKAGKGRQKEKTEEILLKIIAEKELDAQVYVTAYPGDATRFVREHCKTYGAARFIACGGDGTLSEVLNGAVGFSGAEVGVMPLGSGNDFCRNFPCDTAFGDVYLQAVSEAVACDAIRYTTTVNGEAVTGYCANMFNIGFDCKVADTTNHLKDKTVFGGSFAYFLSILMNLIQKKVTFLTVTADGLCEHSGATLLTSVANGKYCGGGIMSNPMASLRDGRINFNIIRNISRLRFVSLLFSYMKGTHMSKKGIEKYILSKHCKTLTVTPENGIMRLCIDGEIVAAGETTFEIVPNAIQFVLPGVKNQSTLIGVCR